ncbi:hypothetical protein ACFOEE_10275 [Pseudoalteromonas fenneropenaei]|uniref:UDP-glucuronosyltransferase n=1 Tax=Pseudoalteromonas fenneropenaei TaxID=1737459 RepID=A0ABV7CKB6_9GAMM
MNESQHPVLILTAASGLGTFAPAWRLAQHFRQRGISAALYCLEQCYSANAIEQLKKTQRRCQADFRAAKMIQQLLEKQSVDIVDAIDKDKFADLQTQWQQQHFTRCIVFSGFWLRVLTELAPELLTQFPVDAVHLDAVDATSWLHAQTSVQPANVVVSHHWLYRDESKEINLLFPTETAQSWPARANKVLCHGGGWHISQFDEVINELTAHQIHCDFISSQDSLCHPLVREIVSHNDWQPWLQPEQLPTLTVADEVISKPNAIDYFSALVRNSRAIISKPGGASLLDSLVHATPLIFLPAYGQYEQKNAEHWIAQGFAIEFSDWLAQGMPWSTINQLHLNLLAQHPLPAIYGVDSNASSH